MIKTNVKSADKFILTNYPSNGDIYENTDELGYKEIIFINSSGAIWSWLKTDYEEFKEIILKDSGKPEDAPYKDNGTVSEEFALKAMAMMVNKESYKDIK